MVVYYCSMPLNDAIIQPFRDNYYELTGEWSSGFICPITLKDTRCEELCVGHVLNQGIRQASRRTVLQRRDVDNYFGTTLEPDLIKYLNFPIMTPAEHMAKARRLTITLPSGERTEAFFAGPQASDRFMQVDLLDSSGKPIASPFVRSAAAQPGQYRDIQIEWTLTVHELALVGALIKSAYLTLFALVGYRYALDSVGSAVRRSLSTFFHNRAGRQNAGDYFDQFRGAVIVSLEGVLDTIPDTLEGGTLLFHYAEAGTGLLFGVSTLFRVNEITLIVTLPADMKYDAKHDFSFAALDYYQALLRDRAMRHSTHLVRFKSNQFDVESTAMEIRYASSPRGA